jgi:hypothetical protein
MSGGLSLSSGTNSSLLLRNAWEDKFFSTLMMTDGASRAASLAGLANGIGTGGIAGGNVSGLAALAAAQQMQSQHNKAGYAAFVQDRVQRGVNIGRNINAEASSSKSSSLKRQTTAEILLEAAGELDNSAGKIDKGRECASARDKE